MATTTILLIAGTIVTAQGAAWVPVTPKTMLQPVAEFVQTAKLGSVTKYKNGIEQVPKINAEKYVDPTDHFKQSLY